MVTPGISESAISSIAALFSESSTTSTGRPLDVFPLGKHFVIVAYRANPGVGVVVKLT